MPETRTHEADPRKYIQLAAMLRSRIRDGTLQPGDRAPSITTLAAMQGGWARQTCAKAFHLLQAEGLLIRVHGLGYYITGPARTPASSSSAQRPVLHVADLLHARREE